MTNGIEFAELLDYTDEEARRWQAFFRARPAAFDVPCDIQRAGSVRAIVVHIFQAELYFGHRALGLKMPSFDRMPEATVDEVFAIGNDARGKLREFIRRATPEQLDETVELERVGKVTRRKMIVQALTHSMRHWAQLATELRRAGYQQDWIHDFIMSGAMR
jgi:uncharacterized damage-inducible protein DinB